ncbi:glycoside hydrolase family 25 protein [Bifidobacterium pseudocatenulatum]|uniref:glycoside hydrolase family 25 protein n=1 Tax=Bifidobacterium pseudocatenulatum TaxID=28026 RepID=UPI00080B0FED|nr:glycoside hydrolase family 25 protein [Bifidobacterium pseudocatenulatum]MCB4882721.1 glycoside hydrolase family 25 protein [Bifidobacterium pseudocatenulatum]
MVSPHHVVKIVTALSAVALTASVAVAPAYALQDIAIEDAVAQSGSVTADNGVVMQSDDQSDDQTGGQQSQDSMPDNPNAKLPDNVSDEISDDATVISEDLAATPEGEVKNIETGEIVTDPTLVGTKDQQPDPLAKTNGESFIPVSAEDVKNAVADANVQLSKFESNEYGAHWGTYNNSKAFFDYQNNLFVQQAKGVIDVSGWQGDIDWAKAKADGVEGVIIRLGYGEGNNADKKAQRNISGCKRLGIPFGIYWYSYADTPALAKEEGTDVVAKLKQFGVNPSDLAYPVYYDLEKWTWEGHQPPTDPNVYNNIVNNWYSALQSAGYKNLGVYSYTSYLQGPLKHADIYAKTTWVAQYGARMGFDSFPTNSRGWQYTSSGKVNGISGNVDMNAFGNKEYESLINLLWVVRDEDIAVGASVNAPYADLEYKWQSYNVNTGKWKTIANWNSANWAGWSDDVGTYWLHLEVRDAASKISVGEKTIAFAYVPGSKRINATYAGWQSKDVLLGVSSDNAQGRYKIKIYDVNKQQWVAGFNGQWAVWEKPSKGIYWTHFELYTSNGKLVETKTYAFGV